MKLYYMPGASSLAAHIVLEWIRIPYEIVRLDRNAIKKRDFLELNPAGAVPTLVHGDFTLTESVAILGYLADQKPEFQLVGNGSARARAEVMRWLAFMNTDLHAAFQPIFSLSRHSRNDASDSATDEAARRHVRDGLARLDGELEGRCWITGSRSIADAYLFVILRWALGTKVGLHPFANLSTFARRMHRDDSVHAALTTEEGLSMRRDHGETAAASALLLDRRLTTDRSATLAAEVVDLVEYREGEGVTLELRRGLVQVDVTRNDAVISWSDEKHRGEAAIPYANFEQYVRKGAIRLKA